MTTAVLVPVLGRPHEVAPLLRSLQRATPEPHRVLFIASDGDTDQIKAVKAAGADLMVVPAERGTYACKINAGYRATTEPLLFTGADDLHFHPGWLTAAQAMIGPAEVVGTDDGGGNPRVGDGRHSCHSLFTRSYIEERSGVVDEPGTVLHEGYGHAYCDDEFILTADRRGVYAHCPDAVVEHLHPFFGKGQMDDTYRLGQSHNRAGLRLWKERKRLVMREPVPA